MEPHADHPATVRRVVLPSGRTVDVVLVVPSRAPAAPPARSSPTAPECCPACAGGLVQPVAWCESGLEQWLVDLRCPDCAHEDRVLLDQDGVDRFDDVLDRGTQALASDLDRLERANREDEVRRFAALLRDDVLRPQDFR